MLDPSLRAAGVISAAKASLALRHSFRAGSDHSTQMVSMKVWRSKVHESARVFEDETAAIILCRSRDIDCIEWAVELQLSARRHINVTASTLIANNGNYKLPSCRVQWSVCLLSYFFGSATNLDLETRAESQSSRLASHWG